MEKPIYFRRCHVCNSVCERQEHSHISHCESCGKALARFQYFDDRLTPTQSDHNLRPPPLNGEWAPIQGLTAYWESF